MAPYPYKTIGEFSYEFITNRGIVYKAYFFDYSFLFPDYPEFSGDVYSFNLEVKEGNIEEQVADISVGETVVSIFRYFFNFKQNVIIYICDASDDRHLARKRKFDLWFWKYNDGTILKEDGVAVIADNEIYNSMLVNSQNKFLNKIVAAFRALNERAGEK